MPRVRKAPNDLEGKQRRKPVRNVRKPSVQVPSVRQDAGRRDRAPRAPRAAQTGAGLLLEETPAETAGTDPQGVGPADRLTGTVTPDTLAAVLAADAPESAPAQEANGSAAPEPLHGETSAPAGADTGPSLADCVAEARMWLDTLDTLAQSVNPNPAPRTTAALHAESTRAGIADALGGVLHYYGLTGAGIVAHPLGALALAMVPLLIPAWADFQAYRAAKAQQQAAKAPPPAPVSSGVADLVSTPLAPASNLHKLL